MSTIKPLTESPRFQPPRSAYVHVPFCRHRCGYCNFTLVAGRDDLIDLYLLAIQKELSDVPLRHPIETLYLGGGTPTHLPPPQLQRLLDIVRGPFELLSGYEFTAEANPLDIAANRLKVLSDAGINRISLGVQSFDDRSLKFLERDHRREDVFRSLEFCQQAFPSVSLDLIFGLPGQTLEDWRRDLDTAIQLAPQHISVYGLTFERGTRFWSRLQHGDWERCAEEQERCMYELAIDRLTAGGYEHYEVSNFARPGFRSRHNQTYWLGKTYFAFGPGAARHIAGRRETNHRSTTTYLKRVLAGESPVAETECLSDEEAARERFVFGMRRLEGIDEASFERETGFGIDELFHEPLAMFIEQQLLQRSKGNIRLTRAGLLVSDALWPRFLQSRA